MKCPACGGSFIRSKSRKLIEHPALGVAVKRRLSCDTCSHRFDTLEIHQAVADVLMVDHFGQLQSIRKSLIEAAAWIDGVTSRRQTAMAIKAKEDE